jgi:hypothetical protein
VCSSRACIRGMRNLHVAERKFITSVLDVISAVIASVRGESATNVEGANLGEHILNLSKQCFWRSAPFIAALTIGGTFHAVSGVGISGQITFGLLGISVQITVGCAPRACTPDRIKVIVCSLTRFQPPCNPSIAARIKTFWPGFTTVQQSSISLIATAASAGSKR